MTRQMQEALRELIENDDSAGLSRHLTQLTPAERAKFAAEPGLLAAAGRAGAENVIGVLLKHGADPNLGSPSPLVSAIHCGSRESLDALLQAGANPGDIPFSDEAEHPVVEALRRREPGLLRALIATGVLERIDREWVDQILEAAISAWDDKGWDTAAEALCGLGQGLIASPPSALPLLKLQSLAKRVGSGLAYVGDQELRSRSDLVCREVARLLTEVDSKEGLVEEQILAGDENGAMQLVLQAPEQHRSRLAGRALVAFIRRQSWSKIEDLWQFEPFLEARDSFGRTPLMRAAWYGNAGLVSELLRRGADPAAKDSMDGWSVLEYARKSGDKRVCRVLEQQLGLRRTGWIARLMRR